MKIKIKPNENSSSSILKGLNEHQLEAVTSVNGPCLVVAGAGSGKTRVLTHRIAYLIESGVPEWSILALTFTNKAAREMKNRIENIINTPNASQVWAGTFHSTFARILRIEAEQIGFTSSFSIYDSEDSQRLVRKVMQSQGVNPKQISPQSIRSKISWSKNKMIDWREFAESADNPQDKHAAYVFKEYQERLKDSNAMDFDDLLLNMIKLLESSQDILSKYQNRFKYILVDEYQDTNKAQYIILNLMANAHQNICVVGDDAQSIYRWRGADIQNILDFQKLYPFSKIVRLEQNYRSTKNILGAADSLIKKNTKQIPKELWTENETGDLIELIYSEDERDESNKIIKIIQKSVNKEFDLKDIAILYRTNAQSLAFENALRGANIPYLIVGGTSFYKRKEVKDAIAYFKAVVNSSDVESIERIINEPPRGIGKTTMEHLHSFARSRNISLYDALGSVGEIDTIKPRAKKSIRAFANMIEKYKTALEGENVSKSLIGFIEETGLLDMYKEIGTTDSLDRWNNIQQLLTDTSQYFRNNQDNTIHDYLQEISLITDMDEADTSLNKITMMTLHAAKGLEFPIVMITGLEQGLFPLTRSEFNPEEEEEERRLFYVGITRAEEKLYLSYASKRARFGEVSYQIPSQFLSEIDKKYIKMAKRENKPKVIERKPINKPSVSMFGRASSNAKAPQPVTFDYKKGDKVEHVKFGKGMITGLKGFGDQRQATVRFDSIGKKILMLKYARLKKI